jgi:hypothetical protein
MGKRVAITLGVVLVVAGAFGAGWLARGQPAAPTSGTKPSTESGEPPISFRVGDPEVLLAAAPAWDTWKYPDSKVESSTTGGGSGPMAGMEFGNTERIALTTPDAFDKVWAFYKEKCQLSELLSESVRNPFQAGVTGKQRTIKVFNAPQGFSFAGPKSDALTSRAFTVHSLRYQLVGFVYRPKGAESTCILLAYRPNDEFVSLLKDHVVKE